MAKTSKKDDKKNSKLIRDSFTMPRDEHAQIEQLKLTARTLGLEAKKSELLRAGIACLAGMSPAGLQAALAKLVTLKTGRPAKAAAQPVAKTASTKTSKVGSPSTKSVAKTPVKRATPVRKKPAAKATKPQVATPVAKAPAQAPTKAASKTSTTTTAKRRPTTRSAVLKRAAPRTAKATTSGAASSSGKAA